jgi:amidase
MKSLTIKTLTLTVSLLLWFTACQSPSVRNAVAETNSWLLEKTITELQQGFRNEDFSVTDVVSAYLDRIIDLDINGPSLNSVIRINPDAMSIAETLDMEIADGKTRGPLHGIPVIIKDNIDTQDNMATSAGATAISDYFAGSDSYIVQKLREAGAIIIAKANLSEWANFRASVSSSGWSGVGGQTKNPYVLDRNPCGSSSGSGVAVSANLCMAAIGTETDGSIVCPSNNNGIVGIKPTVGLLSRTGIIPISFTQDTPGPMTRTVEDAAIVLGTLTGIDPSDTKTEASMGKYLTDYTTFLKGDGLKDKRIGVIKNSGGFSDRVDTLFLRAVRKMIELGAETIEVEAPDPRRYEGAEFKVLLYEFKDGLNKYLAGTGQNSPVKNLHDLIEFNKKDSIELRYFNQKILVEADKLGDLSSPEYLEALLESGRATREEGIDRIMNSENLDALIAPTGSPAWKTDLINGDHFSGGSSSLAAVAGYPAITVPMGFIEELPVGITFMGKAWSEPVLIEIAYSYEQATMFRRPPGYLVTD